MQLGHKLSEDSNYTIVFMTIELNPRLTDMKSRYDSWNALFERCVIKEQKMIT